MSQASSDDSDDDDFAGSSKEPSSCWYRCLWTSGCLQGEELEAEISTYGLTLLGSAVGVLGGLFGRVLKEFYLFGIGLVWNQIPAALEKAGWTSDSNFALCNYAWMMCGAMGALIGAVRAQLLDYNAGAVTSVGAWVKELHKPSGMAPPGRWLMPLTVACMLTSLSGAAMGPEPIMFIIPSVLGAAFAKDWLRQPPKVVRVVALASATGAVSSFFGLPFGSAFFVLEIPHVDGMEFAMEAAPACIGASLTGSLIGNVIWQPGNLIANTAADRFRFPYAEGMTQPIGLEVACFAVLVGLLVSIACHLLVFVMKIVFHPICATMKGESHGHGARSAGNVGKGVVRRTLTCALAGAVNGGMGILCPAALFWGENQMQVALTRGCAQTPVAFPCEPFKLPGYYPGLIPTWAVQARAGHPIPGSLMVLMAACKLLMIAVCETAGFAGGAVYPSLFMGMCLGSAIGALPSVLALGVSYVYISAAAAGAASIAAMANTRVFAVLFIIIVQKDIPGAAVAPQFVVLLLVVFVHYAVTRVHIMSRLNLIAAQQSRHDVTHIEHLVDESCSERSGSQVGGELDDGTEPWEPRPELELQPSELLVRRATF